MISAPDMADRAEDTAPIRCWALSEGHAGMENQCVGLAERIGLPFRTLRIRPRPPWTWLPAGCWPAPLAALGPGSDAITPPWPELLISSGRRSVPYNLLVKRQSRGRTFTVHIQRPQTRTQRFDLVVTPRHDNLRGANVIETLGALHRVTPARLAEAAARFAPMVAALPRPLVAVLIGGSNRAYRLTPAALGELAAHLGALARREGAGLAVTPSRRTGGENIDILKQRLVGLPTVIWEFAGENPYFGFLGLADAIVVTPDSVNMVSEAAATGKPVMVAALPGGNAKFRAFHASMQQAGHTRPFRGRLERWQPPPLDETGRVAEEVKRRLLARDRTGALT